jgi:isocitrate dehydrogenase (NAD+)
MQSAAPMLAHLEERAAAQKLQGAVERVYADGRHLTRDVGGTAEFTDAVIDAMSR